MTRNELRRTSEKKLEKEPKEFTRRREAIFNMMQFNVTNRFHASIILKQLPDDFSLIKVDVKSLRNSSLLKLCREMEKQLLVEEVHIKKDKNSYQRYLKKLLDNEKFYTDDLMKFVVVLGNASGLLSGKTFIRTDAHQKMLDVSQISSDYPIFIDTSAYKAYRVHIQTEEEPIQIESKLQSQLPKFAQLRPETVSNVSVAWADQDEFDEEEFEVSKFDYEIETKQAFEEIIKLCEKAISLLDIPGRLPSVWSHIKVDSGQELILKKQRNANQNNKKRCYRCQRYSHLVRDCFLPKKKKSGTKKNKTKQSAENCV